MHTKWLSATRRTLRVAAFAALTSLGVASAQEGPGPTQPQRADRWVIEFASGAFSLLSRSATTKILPASDELPAVQLPPSGFWFELRSAEGALRYRRIIGDPVKIVFEGPVLDDMPDLARAQREQGSALPPGRGQGLFGDIRQAAAADPRRASLARQTTEPPERNEAIPDQRVFSVLTPAAATGDALILFSSPLEPNSQAEPATEVARFTVQPEIP